MTLPLPPTWKQKQERRFSSEPSLGPVSPTRSGVLDPEGTPLPALGSLRWSGGINSSGGSGLDGRNGHSPDAEPDCPAEHRLHHPS